LQSGRIFKAVGIEIHEYPNVGSEHFLLLKPLLVTNYPGLGNCNNSDYQDYFDVKGWCCSLDNAGEKSFVMYDMINSEQKGKNYLVPVRATYVYLRLLKLFFAE
jgi:hypothetical protein